MTSLTLLVLLQIGTEKDKLMTKEVRVMAKEIIFLVEESPEGGYVARALDHSILTEGETIEEIKRAVKDAVKCHFDETETPKIIRLHLVKDEVIAV